jgi:hypothetical protein
MGRFDALTQLEEPKKTPPYQEVTPPSKTRQPTRATTISYKPKKTNDDSSDTHNQGQEQQEQSQEKNDTHPLTSKIQLQKEEKQIHHDTMIPRHHDTTTPFNHDTMVSENDDNIFEQVRKSVKQIGKEAATHRFTLDEKNELADIEYTYKRQGIRTSENEITRIAINYFIEDYRQNGEQSILAKILKRLNS